MPVSDFVALTDFHFLKSKQSLILRSEKNPYQMSRDLSSEQNSLFPGDDSTEGIC